jgi:phage terminase large subunit-like protein
VPPSLTLPARSLQGAARPRVEIVPAYADTYGPLAVELVARAGQILDPWQQDAINLMLAVREDGTTWACFEYCEWVARQNGKGAILETRALAGMFLFGEELIMWSAHEYKTAMEAFRRCRALIQRLGEQVSPNLVLVDGVIPVKIINTNGEESFEREDTGQRIKFIARSKGSGRGFSGDVNIIDETFAYTPIMQDALMPTMNARRNPQIIYTSSPPLTGDSGEPMYGLRKRAEDGSDPDLGYRDWGLPGDLDELAEMDPSERRTWLSERTRWAQTNPALGVRITEQTIERNLRGMGQLGFAREILGVWPRQIQADGGVIDPELWAALADTTSRPGSVVTFGIDVSPGNHSAAIAAAGRRTDDRLHGKIVDHRLGTGWVVERVVELRDRWNPEAFILDPSGPAGALLADLRAAGIDPDLVSGREMAQACGALMNDAVNDNLRHVDQDTLNAAVEQAKSRTLADAWAWDRKAGSGDICPLVAFTLALHAFRVHGVDEGVPNLW